MTISTPPATFKDTRSGLPPRPVLVVDDSKAQRRILQMQLTRWGYDVTEAGSGEEALALIAEKAGKSGGKKKAPAKKVAKKASKKDKMREIIGNKLKNLATEMGEAASLEEQQKLQSLILALLNFNAGFNTYNTQLLIDGVFYKDKGIYLDKDIPDNQRGLRNGLANEILHNKLVDLQWQK